MTCTCPKCQAQIDIDVSQLPGNGTFTPCPECKSRFWVNNETYARMALRKEGSIYCDRCGNELTHSIVCSGCGVMYPDYYMVQSSKPPRRQVEKSSFLPSFSLRPAKQHYAYTSYTGPEKTRPLPSKALPMRLGLATLLVLVAAGIGYFYYVKKTEQIYAKNYMRALYIIKSGTDITLNTCAEISSDWQKNMDQGQNAAPHISTDVESRLNRIKDSSDRYMQILKKSPKKFVKSNEKLARLYAVYITTYNLAVSPSGSMANYNSLANKSQNDFNVALQELKGSLAPQLSSELQVAKAKYKGLRDI